MGTSIERQKELIDALTVIKKECDSHSNCTFCPLHNDIRRECKMRASTPDIWELNKPMEEWRALL